MAKVALVMNKDEFDSIRRGRLIRLLIDFYNGRQFERTEKEELEKLVNDYLGENKNV